MVTSKFEMDHFSLVYKCAFKENVNYVDVLYKETDKVLIAGRLKNIWETEVVILDENTIDEKKKYTINGNVVKFFDIGENCFAAITINNAINDNGELYCKGHALNIYEFVNNKLNLAKELNMFNDVDSKYKNFLYNSNERYIIIVHNNQVWKYDKTKKFNSAINISSYLKLTDKQEIVNVTPINNELYYVYRTKELGFGPEDPTKRMNLVSYQIGLAYPITDNIGIKVKPAIIRTVSYDNIYEDAMPTYIIKIDNYLLVATTDNDIRFYISVDEYIDIRDGVRSDFYDANNKKVYEFDCVKIRKLLPGFYNGESTISFMRFKDDLLYTGNEMGDLIVYSKNDFYEKEMYMDNIAHNKITDIMLYSNYVLPVSNTINLELYKRDVYPYLDDTFELNTYIKESLFWIDLKFIPNHKDISRKLKVYYWIESKSGNANADTNLADYIVSGVDPFDKETPKLTNVDPGTMISTIELDINGLTYIPCSIFNKYDYQLCIYIEDDLGFKTEIEKYDIKMIYADDPILFSDKISLCYQTIPSTGINLRYDMIAPGIKYIKTSFMSPGAIIYNPKDYNKVENLNIKKAGILEGDYFNIIDDWEINTFSNTIDNIEVLPTSGLDWDVSVDKHGDLVTTPYQGTVFSYIETPVNYRFIGIKYKNNTIRIHLCDLKEIGNSRIQLLKSSSYNYTNDCWSNINISHIDEIKDGKYKGYNYLTFNTNNYMYTLYLNDSDDIEIEVEGTDGKKEIMTHKNFSIRSDITWFNLFDEDGNLNDGKPNVYKPIDKFIFKYKFYIPDNYETKWNIEKYNFEYILPDDINYYIYNDDYSISNNYKSRETGEISNRYEFHLLDVLLNSTRLVSIGKFLKLKTKISETGDLKKDYIIWRMDILNDGTINMRPYQFIKLNANNEPETHTKIENSIAYYYHEDSEIKEFMDTVREKEHLSFREGNYTSSVTLKSPNGRYWDFSILSLGNGTGYGDNGYAYTTDEISQQLREGDMVFLTRNEFDQETVLSALRNISNPVDYIISNDDHTEYLVKDSIDKSGLITSTNKLQQLQFTFNPKNYDGYIPELFNAHYHYFNVYVNGKKLYKDEVRKIPGTHNDISVSFAYPYEIKPIYYILQVIKFNPNGIIWNDTIYDDKRWDNGIGEYYKMTLNHDDRITLTKVTPKKDDIIYNKIYWWNGYLYLDKKSDGTLQLCSLKVNAESPKEKRMAREWPDYYEITSEYEHKIRRIEYLDCKTLAVNENKNDLHRVNTYDGIESEYKKDVDYVYPVEVVLNHSLNNDTEEILKSVIIDSDEDIENLYMGRFPIRINENISNLNNSDFHLFVRFTHAAYYTRVDRGLYEIKRSKEYNILYVKLDNTVLASIGSEIVISTVDVGRTITFLMEKNNEKPYYYLPLVKYDNLGNMQTFYTTDINQFEVIIDGYTLIPNEDYMLINCSLHSHMPSMLLFEKAIIPGNKVEINFVEKDVYSTIIDKNKNNKEIIEILDNENLFVSRTFSVYVNERKLDATQYKILDRKHLQLLVTDRRNVVIRFQYKRYHNMKKILELLHTSREFIKSGEPYNDKMKVTEFGNELYEGIEDVTGVGKIYNLIAYADNAILNGKNIVYNCNIDDETMLDTPINTNEFYNLDYINNDIIIDCNIGYDICDSSLYLPEYKQPSQVHLHEPTGPIILNKPRLVYTSNGQVILEIDILDPDSTDFKILLYTESNTLIGEIREDENYDLSDSRMPNNVFRAFGTKIYHNVSSLRDKYSKVIYKIIDENNKSASIKVDIKNG